MAAGVLAIPSGVSVGDSAATGWPTLHRTVTKLSPRRHRFATGRRYARLQGVRGTSRPAAEGLLADRMGQPPRGQRKYERFPAVVQQKAHGVERDRAEHLADGYRPKLVLSGDSRPGTRCATLVLTKDNSSPGLGGSPGYGSRGRRRPPACLRPRLPPCPTGAPGGDADRRRRGTPRAFPPYLR